MKKKIKVLIKFKIMIDFNKKKNLKKSYFDYITSIKKINTLM